MKNLVLVTGATGHVGNTLVRELLAQQYHVRALVLPAEDTAALRDLPVELVTGDVLEPASLDAAFSKVEIVYHLAGIISIMPGSHALMRKVNVEGTRNVLAAARRSGVRRLVYTSSIHALQRPPLGVVIDESLPFDPDNPAGEYDRTKAEATLVVLDAVRDGLDAVIVCPTGIIGPHDYRGSELGTVVKGWMHQRLAFLTDGNFNWVDVRDIALGHILACERGRTGETYILGGERVSLARLWVMVREAAGIFSQTIIVPFRLAAAAAQAAALWYALTRTRGRFTPYSLETVNSNSAISIAKACRELGYSPRPIADTIRDTVNWWKEYRFEVKTN
ncbi:MAG TPA: SDR family oxidoreductase [Anaerolineaceae bacterium]|nr:SDR family oxidoreductase [Anaerolineaceae bacterium]